MTAETLCSKAVIRLRLDIEKASLETTDRLLLTTMLLASYNVRAGFQSSLRRSADRWTERYVQS